MNHSAKYNWVPIIRHSSISWSFCCIKTLVSDYLTYFTWGDKDLMGVEVISEITFFFYFRLNFSD